MSINGDEDSSPHCAKEAAFSTLAPKGVLKQALLA